jgi:hypothetical protein
MEKLSEVNVCERLPLLLELQPDRNHPSWDFLARALFCYPYCFLVTISLEEFSQLLVNSSFERSQETSPLEHLPTLEEMIHHIKRNPSFLEEHNQYAALYTEKVKAY